MGAAPVGRGSKTLLICICCMMSAYGYLKNEANECNIWGNNCWREVKIIIILV